MLIDQGSHCCIYILANSMLGLLDVLATLMTAIATYEVPRFLRCNNGREFIAKAMQQWLKENNIKTRFIERESPRHN